MTARPQTPERIAADLGLTPESVYAVLRDSPSVARWIRREVNRRIAGTAVAQQGDVK